MKKNFLFLVVAMLLTGCNKYYVVTGNVENDEQMYFGNFLYVTKAPTKSKVSLCVTDMNSRHQECAVPLPKHNSLVDDLSDVNEDGSIRAVNKSDVVAFTVKKNTRLAITGVSVSPIFDGEYANYKLENPILLNGLGSYNYFGTLTLNAVDNTLEMNQDFKANARWGVEKYNISNTASIGKIARAPKTKLTTTRAGSISYMPVLK